MAKATNKATGRDYTYDTAYEARPEQVKNRVARNAARAKMVEARGKEALKGKDVDHIQPLSKGGTNDPRNLRVVSKGANRAKKDR